MNSNLNLNKNNCTFAYKNYVQALNWELIPH